MVALHGNLYDVIAHCGEGFDAAICEAAHCALIELGDEIYSLEWANKYAALSAVTLKQAA
jgi:hypothetical protein